MGTEIITGTETFAVIAPEGKVCAKELSRENIDSVSPEIVPNNSYYRRRIAEGSLLIYNKPPEVETHGRASQPEKDTPNKKDEKPRRK